MKQAIPSVVRTSVFAAAFVSLAAASSRTAHAQNPVPAPRAAASGFAALQGFVMDSIHNAPLSNASIAVEGTPRAALTDADGHYRIDSIPPGQHRIVVLHAVLDTLGIQMRTPAYPFVADKTHDLDLTIPAGERLVASLCSSALRARGPAAMIGFVRDPDTMEPAVGAKVELVYEVTDIIGRKTPTVRSQLVDSTGVYRICGLPPDMSGKVQVFRNGVSSGEVPVEITDGALALRAFSISHQQTTVEVKTDSGKVKRIAKGTARVVGKVIDKKGQPLRDARVMLQGGGAVALTKANGEFVLDSLPSGTQALDIRKLGYSATEVPVELSASTPFTTTVTMSDAVPLLATMRVEAAQDKALSDIGYMQRKQTGMGFFMDGKEINHESLAFSDVMRTAPGLRIMPTGDGRTYVIRDSRSASNGCVNFYVDGTLWQSMTPGDIDQYVRPYELVAVEVYHGSQTPPQFTPAGQGGCATIVAWTEAKVRSQTRKKN